MITLGTTVAPIRMVWSSLMALLWLTSAQSSLLFASKEIKQGKRPLTKPRRIVQRPGRWAARAILFGLGFQRIKVRGKPSKDVQIIVCNHQSYFEHFWHFYKQGCCFLAKEEVAKMPIVGKLSRALQTVFVKRGNADSRKNALEALLERSRDPEWPPLCVYPEGTTTNGDCLLRFHRGVFTLGAPVQPVVLRFPGKHTINPSSAGGHMGKIVLRLITQFNNRMELEYLPVMYPLPKEDPIDFAKRVQKVMADALHVPATDIVRNKE